ncbi:hypothetical protein ACJIZ3_023733 [Penstemon smallii]|uniref:Retrotransposon gag domain-containing protein n=1 Tax=Penstemon smallii TaxID=265156 RepID=A0ABD3TQV8_9LAMI
MVRTRNQTTPTSPRATPPLSTQANPTPTPGENDPNQGENFANIGPAMAQQPLHRDGVPDLTQMFSFMHQYMQFCQQQTHANGSTNTLIHPTKDQTLERFLRFQPPKFFGEPNDHKAELWLSEIENIFNVLDYTDAQKINFGTFRLEDTARHWWRTVEQRWQHDNTLRTWENFVKEFNGKYIPQVVQTRREREFLDLTQGTMTVSQYEDRFTKLIRYAPHYQNDEVRKVRKFIEGLHLELRWAIISTDTGSYTHTVEKALQVESEMKELMKVEEQLKINRPSSSRWDNVGKFNQMNKISKTVYGDLKKNNNTKTKSATNQMRSAVRGPCSFCGHPSHNEEACWKKSGRCIACGSDRHLIKDCPRAKNSGTTPQAKQGEQSIGQTGRPKVPARVYALDANEEVPDPTAVVEENSRLARRNINRYQSSRQLKQGKYCKKKVMDSWLI